jgi:hypothetical protein
MDVNETGHVVGMATTEANVHVVSLINLDFVRLLQGVTDCGPIRSCKFANDAKTMAVGYDKGDLQVNTHAWFCTRTCKVLFTCAVVHNENVLLP